jgi:hypothetical protein
MAFPNRAANPKFSHSRSLQQMDQADSQQGSAPARFNQSNNQGTSFIGFSDMDWANEGFNQINTDVQPADEIAHIAISTEFQHLVQNSTTILDDAHQSNELLGSHFGNLLNKPRSASAAVCTEPQYRSNRQTPIDLHYDTFQNQRSLLAPLDHRLQSNVSLEQPQFRLNDPFHNHVQSSAFSGLGDSPHIFDDQQSLTPLDNDVLLAQSQPGLGNLPYLFDDQQSLHNQPQSRVFSLAQPQASLGDSPHVFDDQQSLHNQPQSKVFSLAQSQSRLGDSPDIFDDESLALLDSQLQSGVLPAQSQPGLGDLPYIFDDQQSLHNQPQSKVFSLAQSQSRLGDSPDIFDDESLAILDSQLQSGVLPAQSQPGLGNLPYLFDDQQSLAPFASFENLSHQQFSAAIITSGSTIPSNPVHFPNEQSSSIVIPLTPASAGYHNTSTALVVQDPRKLTRQTSCIGCRIQKIKVFALPLRQEN